MPSISIHYLEHLLILLQKSLAAVSEHTENIQLTKSLTKLYDS